MDVCQKIYGGQADTEVHGKYFPISRLSFRLRCDAKLNSPQVLLLLLFSTAQEVLFIVAGTPCCSVYPSSLPERATASRVLLKDVNAGDVIVLR